MIQMFWGKKKRLNKMTLVISVTLLMVVLAFSGCVEENGGGEKKTVTITGSTTVLPIASACAEKFMEENPDITVTVSGGGSGHGINAVAKGEADIGDASREAKASDVEDVEGVTLSDLKDNVVAYDIIAVIVSEEVYDANVTDLTTNQVKGIYNGTINNWNQISSYTGSSKEITVVQREEGSGTRDTFNDKIFGTEDPAELKADLDKSSNALLRTTVQGNNNAIGYVGLGYVDSSTYAIKLNGVEAAGSNYDQYKISRSLHMYTLGTPEDGSPTDMYLDYVLSDAGQDIVSSEDFLKVSVVEG